MEWSSMTVQDKQNLPLKKVLDSLLKSNLQINVGVLESPHSGDVSAQSKKTGSNVSVVSVAAVHEFGSPAKKIPKRSFLLSTFESKKKIWPKAFKTLFERIKSEADLNNMLEQFGQLLQRDVRLTFTRNNWKPLKYRSGNPLLDTGQLRRSVSYEIKRGE
jgi:phage gpG-like protein